MRNLIINFLKENLEYDVDFDKLLEKPKVSSQGDFSLPVFLIAKELGKNPIEISKEISERLDLVKPESLSKIESVGPFVNFTLDNIFYSKEILTSIDDGSFKVFENSNKLKFLIEYPSPNTNKALHVGHVRNILLGNSLSKILLRIGNEVFRTNLNNDRGIAVCKAMLGYRLFFSGKKPEDFNMKSDKFVAMCYVKFESESKENESLNNDAQAMLVRWEKGDLEIRELWKRILNWVYQGYQKTYDDLKLERFDCEYFESEMYDKGKEIILKALDDGVEGFGKEDDGAVFCDFNNETYGKKYLLRGDGTTLYMTQDIYLANVKSKNFAADKYIFIVGSDQEYHFQVLFEIFSRLGYGGVEKNYHLSYGMVLDSDGSKFSSRKGNVVEGDELIEMVYNSAREVLISKNHNNLDGKEIERRTKIIGFAAITFAFLKPNPVNDINFDIGRAVSFEGESGPYVLYTYARIQSILSKVDESNYKNVDFSKVSEDEMNLIRVLSEYKSIIVDSGKKYKPSTIVNYSLKLSQTFNEFYQNVSILGSEFGYKEMRLLLCSCVGIVLKDLMELLSIEVLDEM